MSKINHADAIRKLAIQYQAMVAAADALESIGSIEQATKEATNALTKARKDAEVAKGNLATVEAQIRAIEDQAASVIAQARDESKAIIEAAKADAKKQADATIKRAESRAAKIEDEAALRYKAALEQEAVARNTLADMQAERALLAQEVESLKVEHARISALIVDLRSKLGA